MKFEQMQYLENITSHAFEAGKARGLYEAIHDLFPEGANAFFQAQGTEPPKDLQAYLDNIKAGLIMGESGLR